MNAVTPQQLENWPFKLGASFRLVAVELLVQGWSITPFEINEERRWAYFIASKGDRREFLASLKFELYTNLNSRLGYFITTHKARSYEYAKQFNIPVPASHYLTVDQNAQFADFQQWSDIVVKPVNGSSGKGITVGVRDAETFTKAVAEARRVDSTIIIQERIEGYDYRLLFLDYKLFAAIRREPASVIGDGVHTVQELIGAKNAVPKGENFPGTTSTIKLADVARVFGEAHLADIPSKDEKVVVSDKANLSLGGDAFDVTEEVHGAYEAMLQPLLTSLGLRVCGIDILARDISLEPTEGGARLLEINAAPNVRPHTYPAEGENRQPARKIVAMLDALA